MIVVLIWENWDWAFGNLTKENDTNNKYAWV